MSVLAVLKEHWSWSVEKPIKILKIGGFGNLLVEVESGQVILVRPDELAARVFANSSDELPELLADEEFVLEFEMTRLIKKAAKKYGKLEDGFCFSLAIPPVLGGEYSVKNIRVLPLEEYLGVSGDIGQQIQNLPDGAQIELKFE